MDLAVDPRASCESLREWWVTPDDAELDLLQLRMN
jgi:hypothetical protein